ncbi:MAG: ATP-binding protein [Acidimicrobiia bacterium]
MDPDQWDRIFERFYRTDSSRSRDTGGSGLGLSIVAAVVTVHGGRAEASREPGGGAVFTVHLPAA